MPANQYIIRGIIRVGSDNICRKHSTKEFRRDLAAFLWPSGLCSSVAFYMLKVSNKIASTPPNTPCIISGELHKGPEYTTPNQVCTRTWKKR